MVLLSAGGDQIPRAGRGAESYLEEVSLLQSLKKVWISQGTLFWDPHYVGVCLVPHLPTPSYATAVTQTINLTDFKGSPGRAKEYSQWISRQTWSRERFSFLLGRRSANHTYLLKIKCMNRLRFPSTKMFFSGRGIANWYCLALWTMHTPWRGSLLSPYCGPFTEGWGLIFNG